MRTVVPSHARRSVRWSSAFALAASLVLGAAAAQAAPSITNALLQVQINVLDPVVVSQSADPTALTITNTGSTLTSIVFQGALGGTVAFVAPVTDPGAAPIRGVQATVENGDANFSDQAGELGFGGQMPLVGVNKVCLFGPCSAAVANIAVPITVVGAGASVNVTAAVNLTVIGAPWTSMTAAIGSISQMGSFEPVTGMATPAWDVSLVTPVFVSTNIGASAVVPVFGRFSFRATADAPEPATLTAMGGAITALIAVGLSRRKKS